MRFELGLESRRPIVHPLALTIACSYIAADGSAAAVYVCPCAPDHGRGSCSSTTPLIPSTDVALKLSVLITLLALAFFGALKGRCLGLALCAAHCDDADRGAAAAAAYGLLICSSTPDDLCGSE